MSDRITVQRDGGIALVSLNRPDKLNALDIAMFDALIETSASLKDDNSLRCVVLSGEGRAFCAGLDVSGFGDLAAAADKFFSRYEDGPANRAQQACYGWSALPVPVIAAVHGHCFGGGLQLALAADIRMATTDAKLSVMEVKWGLIPDMTGTQTLRHLVGLDVAKELTFSGRVISGQQAHELGLVTRVSEDPRAAALELARVIANKSPDAVRRAKQLLDASVQLDHRAGLELEAKLQGELMGKPNQIEAVMANMQKRDPAFADPS
jgi:enoyl-CoA hydratase/carnithine racemase